MFMGLLSCSLYVLELFVVSCIFSCYALSMWLCVFLFNMVLCFVRKTSMHKLIEKQCTGIGTIKRQIPLLKPMREINKYYK